MFGTAHKSITVGSIPSVSRRQQRHILVDAAHQGTHVTAPCPRRVALLSGAGIGLTLSGVEAPAFAAKVPKGYTAVQDRADGYQYLAPFGWQEVDVAGLDSVYKDLIEPLESVSVAFFPTDKKSITEYGPLEELAFTLANEVLTPPDQTVKIVNSAERTIAGIQYYTFEFETRAPNYTRHALAAVAIKSGKLYALTTGSSERRWPRLENRLRTIVKSFQVFEPVDI